MDLAIFQESNTPSHLIEFKAWSAGDAVDLRKYKDSWAKNHSISKNFEVDASKILAISDEKTVRRWLVIALFTIHCDGFSRSDLTSRGFAYVDLLVKQNKDECGIGDSNCYRTHGLQTMQAELKCSFETDPTLLARIVHVPAFGRSTAKAKDVEVSLDLIGAELGEV